MRAAVSQDIDHLGLVVNRVKFRFDGVRPGRNLAQRQRRCEHLDQDQIHSAARQTSAGRPHARRSGDSRLFYALSPADNVVVIGFRDRRQNIGDRRKSPVLIINGRLKSSIRGQPQGQPGLTARRSDAPPHVTCRPQPGYTLWPSTAWPGPCPARQMWQQKIWRGINVTRQILSNCITLRFNNRGASPRKRGPRLVA